MQEPKHKESRLNFQLERFSFFSDGVFAIAITLLVIEIKVPVVHGATNDALLHSLSEMSLKFLGFLISFGIVGHYWSVHHRIFGYLQKYNTSLLWINLAFLFSVVILPFSSGFIGEYSSDLNIYVPYAVYVANICLTGLMNCWLWLFISNPKKQFLTHTLSKARIRLGLYRSLVIPVVFLISFIVYFMSPIVSRFIPLTIPIILHWGLKGIERLANVQESSDDLVESQVVNSERNVEMENTDYMPVEEEPQ
jgi:uncharacterized membrane protein